MIAIGLILVLLALLAVTDRFPPQDDEETDNDWHTRQW